MNHTKLRGELWEFTEGLEVHVPFGTPVVKTFFCIMLTSVAACGCEVALSNFSGSPTGGCFTLIIAMLFPF